MLSYREIKFCLMDGSIGVEPRPDLGKVLNEVSIDFRLGNNFMIWKEFCGNSKTILLDSEDNESAGVKLNDVGNLMKEINLSSNYKFPLKPGQMVLAETVERLTLGRDVAAKVSGRSSLGRLGLIVHITADLFAPGWDGVPVLELKNVGPHTLVLRPGMAICSFSFYEVSEVVTGYCGRYLGQDGVTVSR